MDELKVRVISYGSGRPLMMYYVDPVSGKRVSKSTGTTDPGEAERKAGEWEKQLRAGLYQSPSKITWAEFRKRYEDERLPSLAETTQAMARTSFNHIESILNPDRLSKLTAATLSKFQAELRKPREIIKDDKKETIPPIRETTIASVLRHLRPALVWAVSMGMLPAVPKIEMPRRAKGQTLARARAVTAEEYERMLAACDKARPHDAATWKRYLTGLWLSGLRLDESLRLSWDAEEGFMVDFSGRRPSFRIYAQSQKSRRDEILPMTPDFCHWLKATFPEAERAGRVFKLDGLKTGKPITPQRVIRIVSNIGKKAGVVVNKADGKFATAHDLRRAFGTRWAKRVMPAILKKMMRHSSIETTMAYYVDLDAAEVADQLWAGFDPQADNKKETYNTSYNTRPESSKNEKEVSTEQPAETSILKDVTSGGHGARTRNPITGASHFQCDR
jgi:integrase